MEKFDINKKDVDIFEITLNFELGGDPNRIYKTMVSLIDAFRNLDGTLAEMIGIEITDSLTLNGIEQGSLKTIIRNVIESLPDEDLRNLDLRKIIGHFLVQSKHAVLKWCQETPKLISADQVEVLESALIRIAENSEINQIPAYTLPNRTKLLTNITSIQNSYKPLKEDESVYFSSALGQSRISNGIEISEKIVADVLTREVVYQRNVAILKVKKPDYLGKSKWLMQFQGHNIDVAIADKEWLNKFQNKEVPLLPGDSVRGNLLQVISYGYDLEVLSIHYELESVDEIIESQRHLQNKFESF